MRTIAIIAGLAISVAAVPAASQAACQKRTTGTVIGALTGGLLGHTIAGRGDRAEGAVVGAAAGGLVGNQVSKCDRKPARAAERIDHPRAPAYETSRYAAASCRYETRPFYDASGQAVYQPTRFCERY